ncbi:MAG: hypothetical protein HN846_02140 [Candidatus Pacebacteria bacterium]|jgi:riboflavin kinase / FMN adenylyltransferase|nr:hypothetical protein [Candidatus Paceibacterota bacterium]MBT3511716.1 hypothetical protein [Candidatus Paceibacterota bacterium]MBT4005145.1 hypothetical protein [Candidatus Paceibacterota bacterium]MBT4358602.1 hypothetical protein [Candidatus Paceibacterota bacterium]MBT4680742.1 hypothetical protein [Candidatus Paceibacterota bacterium]
MLPFKLIGKVIPGEKVGRTIGFPTANLDQVPNESDLKPGVYAGTCSIIQDNKKKFKCLVYFGPRYIFDKKMNSFEVFIYDFSQKIYNETINVTLLKYLRAPRKTKNLAELKTQLEKDKAQG